MLVTSCPSCGDSVTVPSRARPSSRLRCPLCTTEYTLEELQSKLPPVLEIIGEAEESFTSGSNIHGRQSHLGADEPGGVATLVAEGSYEPTMVGDDSMSEIALAEAEPRSVKPTYNFEGGEAGRPKVSTSPRPKKKAKNPILEIVKVVLGGAAAIPAAILILWYVFDRDSLEVGPTIAQYAPWIVPAKFQSKAVPPVDTAAKPANGSKVNALPKRNAQGGLDLDLPAPNADIQPGPGAIGGEGSSEPASVEPGAMPDENAGGLGGVLPDPADALDPAAALGGPAIPNPGAALDADMKKAPAPVPAPAEDKPAEPSPFDDPPAPAGDADKKTVEKTDPLAVPPADADPFAEEAKPAKTPLSVVNAPSHTAPEVAEALTAAKQSLQAFDEGFPSGSKEEKTALSKALYKALADLSLKATFADHADAAVTTELAAVREFVSSLADKADVVQMISRGGPAWALTLPAEQRGTNGVMLIGALAAKDAADKVTAHQLNTATGKQVPLVIAPDKAQADAQVIVLGAIVEEPAQAITGFVGEEQRVVFGDIVVPLPAK